MKVTTKLKFVGFYSIAMALVALAVGCESNSATSSSGVSMQSQQVALHSDARESETVWDDETNLRISMTVD